MVSDRPSAALIDGDNGMGYLVMRRGAELAVGKAKATGVGWVGVRMSNHASPAALYVTLPLKHDMMGPYFASRCQRRCAKASIASRAISMSSY